MIRGFIGGVLWGAGLAVLALAVLSQVTAPPTGQALVPVAADGPVAVAVARQQAARPGEGSAAAPQAENPSASPDIPGPLASASVAEVPATEPVAEEGAAPSRAAPSPTASPEPPAVAAATRPAPQAGPSGPADAAAATGIAPQTAAQEPVAGIVAGPSTVQSDAPVAAGAGLALAAAAPAPAVAADPVPTVRAPPSPVTRPAAAEPAAPEGKAPAPASLGPPRPPTEAPQPLHASDGPVAVALPPATVVPPPALSSAPALPAALPPDAAPAAAAVLPRPAQPDPPLALAVAPGARTDPPARPAGAAGHVPTTAPAAPPGASADGPPPGAEAPASAPAAVVPDSGPAEARPSRLAPDPGLGAVAGTARADRLPRIIGPAAEPDPATAAPVLIEAEAEGAGDLPALERHARAFENPAGKPVFAIVLIDGGEPSLDRRALAAMPFPVTFLLDPSRPESALAASIYREGGQEVAMLAAGLPAGATAADLEVTFAAYGDVLPEAVAIVDPEQGGFQGDRALATMVAPIAAGQGRGLLSWDRGLNAAEQVARRQGLRSGVIYRRLDSAGEDIATMRRYLDRAAFKAAQDGRVIVAGGTRPETVAALLEWAVEGRATTVALAPLSAALVVE